VKGGKPNHSPRHFRLGVYVQKDNYNRGGGIQIDKVGGKMALRKNLVYLDMVSNRSIGNKKEGES